MGEHAGPAGADAAAAAQAAVSRQPHAVLDLDSRQLKALKIERLLHLERRQPGFRLLEVGCGSGGISHYFAHHPQLRCTVDAVDVVDNRMAGEGYAFHLLKGTALPFADHSFEVVITNHVIEHVGSAPQQRHHLAEVRRVLKPEGIGYLAVPNRWQLVEPHYRLAFLSWLPRPLRSPYLRLAGKGHFYDCEPLQMGELEALLAAAGFDYENACVEAMHQMIEIEGVHSPLARMVNGLPDQLLGLMRPIIPTLIYRLQPAQRSGHG